MRLICFTALIVHALAVRAHATGPSSSESLTAASLASSTEAELAFSRGIVLFEEGRYSVARAEFARAESHNSTATRYVELCDAQIQYFEETANAPFITEALQQCSLGCDEPSALDCGDECGLQCGDQCGGCGAAVAASQRPWHLTVLTGYQYDSNVTLEPEFTGLGSGRDISDSSWLVAAFGEYQLVNEPDWNLGLIGSAFTNHYFSANEFDSQDFMGGAYSNRVVARNLIAGVRYEFHNNLLDSDQFGRQHRLVPNITWLEGDFGHTTAYYEFEDQYFLNSPLITAMDRSGDINSVGLTQAIYTMGGFGRWFLGYRFDDAETVGDDFDRTTHMATARIERPIGRRHVVDAEVRYFWDDYDKGNSLDFFNRARRDERAEIRTGWQFYLTKNSSLRVDYTYLNSNSNTANLFGVRFFDFDRHLLATQYIYDF